VSKLIDDERAEFGFDHNQLTQAMLADWGIPRVFQQVAEYHEDPMLSGFEKDSRNWRLLMVLHIADYFSGICVAQSTHRRQMMPQLILMASRLGLELEALACLGDKSVAEWSEWSQMCTIRTAVVPPFAELLEAVPKVPGMIEISDDLEHSAGTFYKLRILLVDDDKTTLLQLKTLLEKTGHTVMTAGTGLEGLGLIDSFKPQLIMTDWVMPEMDGLEFCKALRRNHAWRNIYVFILTAQEGVDKLVTAFEAGANDYMTKPIRPKMLVARLRAAQRVVQLQEEIEFDRRQLHQFADELAASNHRMLKSEVSLRAILDNSPYMTWLKDTEGRYVRVNKSYMDYVRRKNIDQVIGKTDFDFWPKEMAEQYRLVDLEVMASRQQKRIEETSLDGEKIHWVETFKTPVIDEAGKVLGTTGFARDITERLEREALRLTEVRKQRDVLVREVHHRIKNNLQGVVGLLQQNVIDHPEMDEVSQVIIGRIYSIATIHGLQAQALSEEVELDILMKSIVDASVCLSNYVNGLSRPIFLNKEETVPIALVLNELLTNACKHRSGPDLPTISLKMQGDEVIITIVNLFDVERSVMRGGGQGLNLVNSLLPRDAAGLLVRRSGGIYTVELRLSPPVTILG
jgi:PAS domain S-box-containing protein